MRHIHTSIVSRHLATRGNNKILRTPPPHTSSSEERLPRLTRRTIAQPRTSKSPFLKSYLHKVDAKTHPSPLCPLCNIHTHDTHHLFNCIHIRTTLSPLHLWTDPAGVTALLARWTEKLAGGPQAGTSDSPPLARGMGVGRQQQLQESINVVATKCERKRLYLNREKSFIMVFLKAKVYHTYSINVNGKDLELV